MSSIKKAITIKLTSTDALIIRDNLATILKQMDARTYVTLEDSIVYIQNQLNKHLFQQEVKLRLTPSKAIVMQFLLNNISGLIFYASLTMELDKFISNYMLYIKNNKG